MRFKFLGGKKGERERSFRNTCALHNKREIQPTRTDNGTGDLVTVLGFALLIWNIQALGLADMAVCSFLGISVGSAHILPLVVSLAPNAMASLCRLAELS
jgi:hypothetical protein